MTLAQPLLSIRNLAKRFGATIVLEDISFDIGKSEFLTVLGESGSGKTTLLRILAGFERPDAGEVWMENERLDGLPPNRRNVNTVFQSYALFPHMTVIENVAYGLRSKKVPAAEIRSRVEAALGQIKMSEFSQRRPAQLSGGQQQRVALARALVNRPRVLLLDEPLSALDANLRKQMQIELKALQSEVGIAFVFVTHDQEEAMGLSDRIALLRHGRIEQIGSPRELYNNPRTPYAAMFIGQTNLLRARVENRLARVGPLTWPVELPHGELLVSLRPEHIGVANVTETPPPGAIQLRGTLRRQVFTGASESLEFDCGEGLLLQVRVPNRGVNFTQPVLHIHPEYLTPLTPAEAH